MKSGDGDNAAHYSFYYENKPYVMILRSGKGTEPGTATYGEPVLGGEDLQVSGISEERKRELFEKTHKIFFVEMEISGEGRSVNCALWMHLLFEGEEHAVYYDREREGSPLYIFKLEEGKPAEITDELKLRRLKKWFADTYRIV